ncbi:MAG TPA: hypothetical protein VGN98_10960 [Tianweitania sediminis]|jgi:hypothetical protein|nr:hypothetical protein [Tianweitania sediminis]
MTSTSAFISELTDAADRVEMLTKHQRAALLELAAVSIEHLRSRAGYGAALNDAGDMVLELRGMAQLIVLFSAAEVATIMLSAASVIQVAQSVAEQKAH